MAGAAAVGARRSSLGANRQCCAGADRTMLRKGQKAQQTVRRANSDTATQAAHCAEEAPLHYRIPGEPLRQEPSSELAETVEVVAGLPWLCQRRPRRLRSARRASG